MTACIVTYKPAERDTDRPWGMWETTGIGHLENGLAYCDKIITVNPGCELSIQKHEFRREEWEIVEGEGTAYLGESPEILEAHRLKPGDKIHIPLGKWHRVRNTGANLLRLKERQSGIYLDEQDILRHPTATDPRTTDEAAMKRIRAEVATAGLKWPGL